MADNRGTDQTRNLGQLIKQQRTIQGLTLEELSAKSGDSSSHLGRIERGERFPSARILRRIAKPLGFAEVDLFSFADFLSPQASAEANSLSVGRLDPYVSSVLSQETVETQRAVVTILVVMKSMAKR